jgi:RecB family exonuclease
MAVTRRFLGLKRPALHLATEYLFQRYGRGQTADMSGAIVVLPGRRAGRRLLEILVEHAEQHDLVLAPPLIETVGRVPEQLYRPKRPFATDFVQQLAWSAVLQTADRARLQRIITHPPGKEDLAAWHDLGQLFWRLHTELAADGLDFGEVAGRGEALEAFGEAERWKALSVLQQAYLRQLDDLQVWDIQTARLVALKQHECRTDKDLIVVGTVDMTITLRKMLDQVAERVTALVFAPPQWAGRFDEHGCVLADAWQAVSMPVRMEQVHLVDDPTEQADRVVRCLAEYAGRYRADEITVGLADERITPYVERQLRQCGIASRSAAGTPLTATAPFRLLSAVEAYLRSRRYPEFASLVRHADLFAWLERGEVAEGWLEQLDAYYGSHLQTRLSGDAWLGEDVATRAVRAVYERVEGLLKPLRGGARPLGEWGQPLRDLLLNVYGHRDWDRDDEGDRLSLQAFDQINATWIGHEETIPQPLIPVVRADEALQMTLGQLQSATVSPRADPEAMELLGWLELPLDDAPALVVCTFNEGHVPSSINSDIFLPDALRNRLGLQDNARRYARDAYALSVLLASRRRVDLIVGRRNADGDPLVPSRLLFATDREEIARRASQLFAPPTPLHELAPLAGRLVPGTGEADFVVPLPESLDEPIRELSVTAFRDYLACPYRFYLARVLRLQAVDDAAEELDGAAFGTLLHEVLRQFGRSPCRDSTDPDEIRVFLRETLDQQTLAAFGGHALASVWVQVEQLRVRLDAFAEKQAEWAGAGWRIEHAEVPERSHGDAVLEVDGQPMVLRGRIDRIDRNRDTGRLVILDYKSSDAGKPPEKVHQRAGRWVDLQLPLYRHLVGALGISGPVQVGYVLLPKDTTRTEFRLADWSEAELAAADEVARDVVRNVRAQRFWPPTEPPPDYSEEFAPICQDGVFEKRLGG